MRLEEVRTTPETTSSSCRTSGGLKVTGLGRALLLGNPPETQGEREPGGGRRRGRPHEQGLRLQQTAGAFPVCSPNTAGATTAWTQLAMGEQFAVETIRAGSGKSLLAIKGVWPRKTGPPTVPLQPSQQAQGDRGELVPPQHPDSRLPRAGRAS